MSLLHRFFGIATEFYLPLIYPVRQLVLDFTPERGVFRTYRWRWYVPRVAVVLSLKRRGAYRVRVGWTPGYAETTARVPPI